MIWSLNIDPLRQITETNRFSFFNDRFLAEWSDPDHRGRITPFSISLASIRTNLKIAVNTGSYAIFIIGKLLLK